MEDQDRDHISSRSHFSGRSDQELDEMLDELRAGKIGINQPGQNSSEHDSEDTPEENDNASGTGNAEKSKKGKSRKEGFNLRDEVISWIQVLVAAAIIAFCVNHSSSPTAKSRPARWKRPSWLATASSAHG